MVIIELPVYLGIEILKAYLTENTKFNYKYHTHGIVTVNKTIHSSNNKHSSCF